MDYFNGQNPMANENPNPNLGMMNPMPAQEPTYAEPAQMAPQQVQMCEPTEQTCCMPGMYDPPIQYQQVHRQNVIVPHIHQTHTTHVQHTHYIHQHYFPHTESVECCTTCEEVMCTPPPCPCPPPHHFM